MATKSLFNVKDNDVVEYFIYPDLSKCNDADKILEFGQQLLENIYGHVLSLSENYIWHNDSFNLVPSSFNSDIGDSNEPVSFHGSVNYGENIEDEWFIVYLLLEISKRWKDLVIRVKDSDGEFLLIEAAEQLPNWVTPESCEDKVFLHRGCLHILPKSFKNKPLSESLQYVRQHKDKTKANIAVQEAIDIRIKQYPSNMVNIFHHATLYLPVSIAAVLEQKPGLVAPAVQAFCERDSIDLKACRAMKYFPPESRVMTSIKFTRCLYAMLTSTKYVPDKRTGWDLPQADDELYKSHLLGVKLACGFEILLSQVKSQGQDDKSGNNKWKGFLSSLESKNYFKGLLEGCEEYCSLLNTAKQFYTNCCEKFIKPSAGEELSNLLDNIEYDVELFKRKETIVPESDDDSWLNLSQEELDEMLEQRFGKQVNGLSDKLDSTHIASQLNNFINNVSGIDGAEFPHNKLPATTKPTRPKRGVKKKKSVKFTPDTKLCVGVDNNKQRVNFDPEGFMHAIQNILDFKIPDDNYWESDGSGMSSYEDEADMELGEPTVRQNVDSELIQYMDEMDQELSTTTLAQSFVKSNKPAPSSSQPQDSFDDVETFEPVDIDLNALKNILTSYQSQLGEAGPAENLLGPMGVNLDDVEADVD